MDITVGGSYTNEKELLKFSFSLVSSATEENWDDSETGKLVLLICKCLRLSKKKIYKFLNKCRNVSSSLLIQISGHVGFTFPIERIIKYLTNGCTSQELIVSKIDDAIENELIDIKDTAVLESLKDTITSNFSLKEMKGFVLMVCEHANSKDVCGRVLDVFTSTMHATEAVHFIVSIISYEFFHDLEGDLDSFILEFREVGTAIRSYLSSAEAIREGQDALHDSDEDENGDLRGFIAAEGDISSEESFYLEDSDQDCLNVKSEKRKLSQTISSPMTPKRRRSVVQDDEDEIIGTSIYSESNATAGPQNITASQHLRLRPMGKLSGRSPTKRTHRKLRMDPKE